MIQISRHDRLANWIFWIVFCGTINTIFTVTGITDWKMYAIGLPIGFWAGVVLGVYDDICKALGWLFGIKE